MKKIFKKLILFTDGGSRGNPGNAGVGVVICDQKENILKEYGEFIGVRTNNEAEYEAVIFGLKKIKLIFGKKKIKEMEIEVRSDSELLVKQLNGEYKILDKKIQPLFLQLWNLKIDFKKINFKLIPREENKRADFLLNQAINQYLKTKNEKRSCQKSFSKNNPKL